MVADQLKPKVLLIDDDPLIHRLYQPHIERAGYQMLSLVDASEVLQAVSREQPRVVVIDMVLPGSDGLATILLLKAVSATKSIPIIAISADPSYHNHRQQLQMAGVDAFLSKPFGAARLVAEIRRLDQGSDERASGRDDLPSG